MPNVPTELLQANPEELQDLGLVLLSQMASNVSHTTISGWHYVEFTIDRRDQEDRRGHAAPASPTVGESLE